jgi:HlyD family secretion protein
MKKKVFIIAGIVIAVAAGLYFYSTSQARKAQGQSKYQTENISRGTFTASVGATGTVHSNQSAVLIWQTNGIVEDVKIKMDDEVKAKDVLATLSKTSLSQNIIMAEADLVSAQKSMEDLQGSQVASTEAQLAVLNAKDDYKDALQDREALNHEIKYYEKKMTSLGPRLKEKTRDATAKEIEEADAKLAVAEAKLMDAQRELERIAGGTDPRDIAAAQAMVAAAQATIDLARISAPFAGRITEVNAKAGDVVSAGVEAFRLDDMSHLLVDLDVSEVDINQVKIGQSAKITFDSISGKEYSGLVTSVARVGTITNGVVNFIVTIEIEDADEYVLPQMTAGVNIVTTEHADVLLIPNRAVRQLDGKRVVFILKDNVPTKVEITAGSSNGTYSELVAGDLLEGDAVILNPGPELTAGPGGMFMMGGR